MFFVSDYYKKIFSCKVYKLSIDAGCTCPNRDGTKGTGGCIFCSESGSGEFSVKADVPIERQIQTAKGLVEKKLYGRDGLRKGKYIAYFQSFTSTYGESETLLAKYKSALSCEDVAGLAIATRPDCLSDEILTGIAELSKKYFVQLELGLQTSNETTGLLINRCYSNADYIEAVKRIKKTAPEIHIVSHLIFGLPGENEKDMLESVRFVVKNNFQNEKDLFGLKITVLYILEKTKLSELYRQGKAETMSKENYYFLLKKAFKLLPENCVIHRLTGDPPKKTIIEPKWTTDKKRVMNEIRKLILDLDNKKN